MRPKTSRTRTARERNRRFGASRPGLSASRSMDNVVESGGRVRSSVARHTMLGSLPASRLRLPLSLGVLSSLNLLFALLAQWYVVVTLGAGAETDELLAGAAVPQLVLAVFSGSLSYVLVPLLAGESRERFQEDAWGFLWLVGGAFAALALVLFA